ncbi:hypothetical protein SprV_0100331500 [Sparganum proliferum]
MYDVYDLWEDRMKLYLESVSEGNRSLAILGQLDTDVYAVARAANITSSLTTATIFERLRREFGRSPMPWVARATLRERRQHSGESVVDFQRHLRVLAKQAYPDDSCSALEDRILDNFVDGIANLDIRRKFMLDPPKTLKAALDSARDEEVIYAALSPSPGPSSSVPSGPRFQTAPPQSQMVNVFAMGPRPTCDIGTQTARWQWDPQPQSTPRYDHQRSTPRRGNWRDQRGRWNRPQYRPGVHTITAGEEEESVTVSMSVDRTPEVFMPQHDAKDTISCCYSSNILERLFQVKSQPWRFLLQNINWSKLRILDDFLQPGLPVYEELSSLIVESDDSHNPICNVSFLTGNGTLSVHFDFCSRLSILKCTLQIDQDKLARVIINVGDAHEKTESCEPREDLGRTDYTAFCMPVHLTVQSGERFFMSIAVRSIDPPTGDSYRITLMFRRFRSARIESRVFYPNQLPEILDWLTNQLKISHTNTNFS